MEYDTLDVSVSRRLGNADVVYSDTWIALQAPQSVELRLSREEFERIVEGAPQWWFETIDLP